MTIQTWAVGVITAPRPIETLARSLASVHRAGWPEVLVAADLDHKGCWRNWLEAVKRLTSLYPQADAYAIFEDDVVYCRNLRQYLQHHLWPAAENVALCSVFCPAAYRLQKQGWHEERRWPSGSYLVSSQAWILPPQAARAVVSELWHVDTPHGTDGHVGQWAEDSGRTVWYHTPSLAQHVADEYSAVGCRPEASLRVAVDFVGEDAAYEG